MAFGGGKDDPRIVFSMHRKFEAPRERVWQAYTDPALLAQWWGPKGSEIISCTGLLRPGAMFLYGLHLADGHEVWGRMLYREVWAPMQLVYVAAYTDRRGTPVRNPLNKNWPMELATTVNFDKAGTGTQLSMRIMPQNATEPEKKAFADYQFDMKDQIGGMYEKLDHLLAR
jgi:uncharacterized protein YndB with AHSA1/START domain